jgi:hypothetical protein
MKKELINKFFTILLFTMILPTINHAQELWDDNSSVINDNTVGYPYDSNNYSYRGNYYPSGGSYYPYWGNYYYGDVYGNNYPLYDYSPIDYHYEYYSRRPNEFGRTSSYLSFGRKFDNSDNFSSGISSYQGTSTGPGPNGGYPGTPHGIYPTNYVNTSIYPNIYMRISPSY